MSSNLKTQKCKSCDCDTYTYIGLTGLHQKQLCKCCDDGQKCPKGWTKYTPDFSCGEIQLPFIDLGLDEDDD